MKNIARLFFALFALVFGFGFQSCEDVKPEVTVKTHHVTDVTTTSVKIKGTTVITAGDVNFTDAGICISSKVSYPKINDSRVVSASGDLSEFVVSIANLSADSVYKFRAFASTSDTIYYGITYSFRPASINIETIAVPGGAFTMGATSEQTNFAADIEKPAHSVTLSSFNIGKFEVTNSQFAAFLNSRQISSGAASITSSGVSYKFLYTSAKGLYFDNASYSWKSPVGYENRPVVNVTWYGASEFCLWAGGRLPTESEWEFAARGGKSSAGYIYSGGNDAGLVGWFKTAFIENEALEYYAQTGGGKNANELGIYDMSGNVWEWCSDWYAAYPSAAQTNPTGPTDAEALVTDSPVVNKVRRGGGWADPDATSLRVSKRASNLPSANAGSIGFRFAKQ